MSPRGESARANFPPSRELQVLLQCARPQRDNEHAARVRAIIAEGLDWQDLFKRAAWHRMLPLLHWHLSAACPGVGPQDVRDALANEFLRNARRMLRLSGELTGILSALRERGVPALPYKGPLLAARLYGNLALRASGDLDILVRRCEVARAREVLIARGYQPRYPINSGRLPFMLASRYSEPMLGADFAQVELHWAFTNRDVSFALDCDTLLERARTTTIGGVDLPILADDDLALVLCVHGAKHRWNRLEWIAGLATLIGAVPDLDYDLLLARARELRSHRRVLLGLLVAHDVLDAPTPNEVVEVARTDRTVPELCREVWQSLEVVHARSPYIERAASLPFDWFHLRLSDSLQDRVRLVTYRLTTPSQPELWNTVTWGKHSVPLHALVRPLQIALRIAPATWSFLRQRHAHLGDPPQRSAFGVRSASSVSHEGSGRPARTREARSTRARSLPTFEPLRILQLVQKPQRRGAEIVAQQLNNQFVRLGHLTTTVYLYTCAGNGEDQLALQEGDVILGESEDHVTETVLGMNPRLTKKLLRRIDEFQPDIIQLNGARTVKYGALLRLLRPTLTARTVYRNIGDPRDWVPRGPKRLILRRLMREIDGTIGIGSQSLSLLRTIYRVAEPTAVIPNGILPEALEAKRPREEVREEFRVTGDTPVILFVGSLTTEKRVDLLLDAFHDVRRRSASALLWIVGAGPLRTKLAVRAAELSLGTAVRFFGLTSDVGTIMAAADILALASDTEGMPAVALEAGYHSLPVVSTRVGSIEDCVVDGETGLLVERGNIAQLADALHSLVHSADRRKRMGDRSRARISELFTIEKIAAQYLAFFQVVLRTGEVTAHAPNIGDQLAVSAAR